LRGPGRREIGHGALAERALARMVPPQEAFPYTIRIVSETLESNGSSSMAAVCGGCLSLMDAGVPVKSPVAGIAMGLIAEGSKYAILSDILGDEDHLGDMDFKVCGTARGVTAIQMDIKIEGLSRAILQQALDQAREGRLHILGKMLEALPAPRPELSKYAPRITTIKVKPDQIRLIIGPGGKTIKGIVDQTGVAIDVNDDGTVNVASADSDAVKKALDIIKGLTAEPEVGATYKGTVKRITDFGAFVEILLVIDVVAGDVVLGDVVGHFDRGLDPVRLLLHLAGDPDHHGDGQHRSEEQVEDRPVDREVDAPELDVDPGIELELVLRLEGFVLAAAAVIFSVTGCGKPAAKAASGTLVVWSFTDELKNMIDKYYTPSHPTVTIEYSLTPTDQSVRQSEWRERVATTASLRPLFHPRTVAVIGASRSPQSIGYRLLDASIIFRPSNGLWQHGFST